MRKRYLELEEKKIPVSFSRRREPLIRVLFAGREKGQGKGGEPFTLASFENGKSFPLGWPQCLSENEGRGGEE